MLFMRVCSLAVRDEDVKMALSSESDVTRLSSVAVSESDIDEIVSEMQTEQTKTELAAVTEALLD